MKANYLKILFNLCLLIIVGCSGDNPTENSYSNYNGTWQLFKITGGFTGSTYIPGKGNITKLSFGNYYTFKLYRNDTLKVIANYKIDKLAHSYNKISYSNIISYKYDFYPTVCYAQISSDTLITTDGYADGYTSYYRKVTR